MHAPAIAVALTLALRAAPAAAQDLGGLTDLVEETASTAEGVVSSVEETATEVVGTVTETVAPSSSEPAPSSSTSEGDDPLVDVQLGTGDGTLDVDLQVDVAPSDADGSPQLEIDGGATVADQHVDVGGATDPIEDAVDPDPAPSTAPEPPASGGDGGTDGDTTPATAQPDGPGGFLEGGGVVAAGDDARPVPTPGDDPAAQSLGSGFAAFGALDRGSFGLNRQSSSLLGRHIPGVMQFQIRVVDRQHVGIGQTGSKIGCGIACNMPGRLDRFTQGLRREIGR